MLIIGIAAAICSTSASIPQLMGHTSGLSPYSMVLRSVGAILWSIYGVIVTEYTLMISSIIQAIVEIFLIIKTICLNKTKETKEFLVNGVGTYDIIDV